MDMGIGLNVIAATFGCEAIFQYGTEEQKQKYLPPVCKGDWVAAGAYTEPNAGTDVAGYKTRAVQDGSDFVINGNKMFITNGTVCDFMVVQAITEPEEKKHKSFSMIIVDANTRASPATSSRASWASAPATRPRSPSRTCGCPRQTCWARRAAASTSSCTSSTRPAP